MNRIRCKNIDLEVWKWHGTAFVGGSLAQFASIVKQDVGGDVNVEDYHTGYTYLAPGVSWFLWVDSLDNVPTLAHEAFHVASGILEARGLALSRDSEEAYTYTLEHIMRQVLDKHGWRYVKEAPHTPQEAK